ncbi:OadG family protein [Sedimenticola sp.]|uniref:OadG family protein n=1 Tax=Sedimenticola sp. TaxID=1940285 RepID=UPI003D0D95A5
MHVSDQLAEGVNLMLLGMGSVFLFLTVLVLVMHGVSKLVGAISTDVVILQPESTPASKQGEEIIAVISAAISRYRSKH